MSRSRGPLVIQNLQRKSPLAYQNALFQVDNNHAVVPPPQPAQMVVTQKPSTQENTWLVNITNIPFGPDKKQNDLIEHEYFLSSMNALSTPPRCDRDCCTNPYEYD